MPADDVRAATQRARAAKTATNQILDEVLAEIDQDIVDRQRSGRLVLDQKRGSLHVEGAPIECVKCFSDELTIHFQWWGDRHYACACRTCEHEWVEHLSKERSIEQDSL
jgi:hypothetical protein